MVVMMMMMMMMTMCTVYFLITLKGTEITELINQQRS